MGRDPFEAVVTAHQGEIYRYLRRATVGVAEDLSQETFLRAYRAYPSLPADANVRAWLFAIATNLARNHSRGERRRRAAYTAFRSSQREDGSEGPEGAARFIEARTAVEAVVDRLPVKQRLALILRKFHDLPYEEVGRSLDCSPEAARAHVFQAFRKIRHSLEDRELPGVEVG